jgi:hypothetical protein
MSAPPIYLATILEIERRRLARGIPMEQMSDLMGTAERSYAKLLYPDTASGRQARWETIQLAVSTLFPDGFELRLDAVECEMLCAHGTKQKILAEAAHWNGKTIRETMQRLQVLSRAAYLQRLTEEARAEIARKAAQARWAKGGDQAKAKQRAATRAQQSKRTPQQRRAIARKAAAARWAKVRGECIQQQAGSEA